MFQYFKVVEIPLRVFSRFKKNIQETKLEKGKKTFLITNQVYILLNGH